MPSEGRNSPGLSWPLTISEPIRSTTCSRKLRLRGLATAVVPIAFSISYDLSFVQPQQRCRFLAEEHHDEDHECSAPPPRGGTLRAICLLARVVQQADRHARR